MDIPLLFKDQLLSFDNIPFRPIQESDIYNLIQKQIPDNKKEFSLEEKAELIAFKLLENHKSENVKYGEYYKSNGLFEEENDTKPIPYIDIINTEMLGYWRYRSETSIHPVLIARYAGLVFNYSSIITGNPAHHLITKRYTEALLDLVEQDLYVVPAYSKGKVRRALDISLFMNDKNSVVRCKDVILALGKKIATTDHLRVWSLSYDLLVKGKKKILSESETKIVIDDLDKKMQEILLVDSHAAEYAAVRLAEYYFVEKRTEDLLRVLANLEIAFAETTKGFAVIQQVHYVEKMYQLYKQFQLNDSTEIYLRRLRELNIESDKELKVISSEINIPKEKIDKYLNQLFGGDDYEHIFIRLVEAHSPKIDQAEKELNDLSKNAGFYFMLSRSILDKKGRRIAKIGSLKEDPKSHLIIQLSNTIRIGTVLLHFAFDEGIKREIFTQNEVMKFISKSCIINSERIAIIEEGIQAYFDKDYLAFIHLIVPQFEEAIRNLVEMNGGIVLVQKEDAFQVKTLDHLLNDEIVKEVFGEDMSLYFKVLFTDKRGWNFRNDLAHGMLSISQFNKQNSDRLMHALLCLGMVRPIITETTE